MAHSVTLYPLGVGSFGVTRLFHISLLLHVDERTFFIDCPRRLFEMLAFNSAYGEVPVSAADYQDVILTHLHIDHAGGIVELAHAQVIPEERPVNLYAPASTLDYLWSSQQERGVVSAAQVTGGATTLSRYFRPVPLSNPHDFGCFTLHFRATQHIANTFAYRFDFGNFRLGISADAAYDEELLAWLDTCNLILHDVLVPPWSEDEEVQKLHAPLAKLMELPEAFQQKTFLYHYDDDTVTLYPHIGKYRYLEQNRLLRLVG
jgi:ribonuclease BN (tRNA processing enzyme)